jgi:hypothetical protein
MAAKARKPKRRKDADELEDEQVREVSGGIGLSSGLVSSLPITPGVATSGGSSSTPSEATTLPSATDPGPRAAGTGGLPTPVPPPPPPGKV